MLMLENNLSIKFFILMFLILIVSSTNAQNFPENITLNSLGNIPCIGYEILDTVTGDLNRDKYRDLLVVLKLSIEENNSEATRPLLIYLGQKSGVLKLIARNDNVVLCRNCGGIYGDPYSRMVIKNGYFTIEHYGGSNWRWTRYITFKYSSKDSKWYLHKDGGDSYHISDPNTVKTEVKTTKDFGTIEFDNFKN